MDYLYEAELSVHEDEEDLLFYNSPSGGTKPVLPDSPGGAARWKTKVNRWFNLSSPRVRRESDSQSESGASCSMSNESKDFPPNMKNEAGPISPRSESGVSCSMSDDSKDFPPNMKNEADPMDCGSESGVTCSMSDWSKDFPPNMRNEPDAMDTGSESGISCSMKSDMSKDTPPNMSNEVNPMDREIQEIPGNTKDDLQAQLDSIFMSLEEHIVALVKQELQRFYRLLSSEHPESSSESAENQSIRTAVLNITLNLLRRMELGQLAELLHRIISAHPKIPRVDPQPGLNDIFTSLEEHILAFVKQELQRFHRLLSSKYQESSSEGEEEQSSREAFLNITQYFLKGMEQEQLANRLQNRLKIALWMRTLKCDLHQKYQCVFEGVAKAGSSALLQQIYTELYITGEGTSGVNQEHEVRQIETASRKPGQPETAIRCEDLFEGPVGTGAPTRTVLTKGVSGIGKTVLTQKFILDWAEGRTNQDIQLLFPFTFRELNVLRDRSYSLVELLHFFFRETKGLSSFEDLQVLFILDGLDECRLPLDFSRTRVLTEPTESASVEVLMVNLIRGDLLPSARLWITTRPAAANQIPAWCVSMVTEVRGFTDPQKEQYFRKRFRDEQQATAVISHIKKIHSLYIMCHLPIFCWILSMVLEHVLNTRGRGELPKTLTEMYIHFLVVQVKVMKIKYEGGSRADPHWSPETREMVRTLGKLAFEQLQKGNLIFYESDLSECGLDTAAASVYSGVFTQVFREEPGLYQDKVYCFIHLSVQEFLAALHVHQTFVQTGINLLEKQPASLIAMLIRKRRELSHLHRFAVDQALQSPNGLLDLFLRFLLGLSLPTNQSLLQGLMVTSKSQTNEQTVKYIKDKLNEGLSPERSINLFHCLNELNDHSILEKITHMFKEGRVDPDLSPAEWSAVAFLLLSSESDLEEFDLRKFCPSEEVLLRLLPVVKASNKAILSGCDLSPRSCGPLASVLSSSFTLKHLDLNNNHLQDPGVQLLCAGLKSSHCSLETLSLSRCLISEKGGASLVSALGSSHSHLRDLDLSYNHPGPTIIRRLKALQEDPHCALHTLRLDPAGAEWLTP